MKKTLVIIVAALGLSIAAMAQPKAIGGRLGNGLEASYQHYIGNPNFLEVNAGLWGLSDVGFKLTGTYNFVFPQPSWSPRGHWAWYAGPGVTLGTAYYNDSSNNLFIGLLGQVGLEYEFWFPLQLSADLRPTFGFCDGEFYNDGFTFGFIPTIGVRYCF